MILDAQVGGQRVFVAHQNTYESFCGHQGLNSVHPETPVYVISLL